MSIFFAKIEGGIKRIISRKEYSQLYKEVF